MRQTLLLHSLLLLLLSSFQLAAQRIAEPTGTVSFVRYPATPLPAEYTTYSVSVHPASLLSGMGWTESGVTDQHLALKSFKRLPRNGHFHIAITLEDIQYPTWENKKQKHKTKTKDGKEKIHYTYSREISYFMPVTVRIEDYKGEVLYEKVGGNVNDPVKFSYTKKQRGRAFTTRKALDEGWREERVPFTLKKELATRVLNEFAATIASRFDTRPVQERFYLEEPKGKKLANVELYEKHTAAVLQVLTALQPGTSLESTRASLAEPLAFWATEMQTLDPTDKKQRKVYHACAYNRAMCYFWLDDLAAARTEAEALQQAVDWNKDRVEHLLTRIARAETLLAANEAESRYLVPTVPAAAEGPAEADYSHLLPAPTRDIPRLDGSTTGPATTLPGYVIINGDSLTGTFQVRDGNTDRPRFYKSGNIVFQKTGGETRELPVLPSGIQRMRMGETEYHVHERKALLGKKLPYFMRVLETGPRMTIYEQLPHYPDEKGEVLDVTTLFLQKDNEKLISLDGTNVRFVDWQGAFAKFFTDCPVLEAEIMVGEFKRERGEIVRAARLYNQNSCE